MTKRGEPKAFMLSLSDVEIDECITYPFCRTVDGYGRIRWNGNTIGAHVVSAELAHGKKPDNSHEACHSCGNGHLGCVNPKHIYWGTRKQNVADAIESGVVYLKNAIRSGERCASAKFSDAVIEEVRARVSRGEKQKDLSAEYGISKTHVSRIAREISRVRVAMLDAEENVA